MPAAKVDPDTPKGEDAARLAELSTVAGEIVDAFSNQAPRITPDGKQLVSIPAGDLIVTLALD